MTDDRLLTPRELAEVLRCSTAKLERQRHDGSGPKFLKLGKGRRAAVAYRWSDVEAYLDSCERRSTRDRGSAS